MPVRNGYKSHNGRSAVARKVLRSGAGNVNGMMPQKEVWTVNAGYVPGNTYFGGPKKGGLAPTATGFMRPNGVAKRGPRGTENYLFQFAGYSAQKDTSECTGSCALGLDYLVKNVWSWSFFMNTSASYTYRNTYPIEPSANASFIVDKVGFFTKSNLNPAPSNSGLEWLHGQSQDRYVISFSDENNHNFSDKAPAILIGDRLYFAIGSNHGWDPESQWNNGEFYGGELSFLVDNNGAIYNNGNVVWSRPLNRSLVTKSVSTAITIGGGHNYIEAAARNDLSNMQTLYQYLNQNYGPQLPWSTWPKMRPYVVDVGGYYGTGGGGNSGNIPLVDKTINGKFIAGISPIYNVLYITFGEFNACGEFVLSIDGYYVKPGESGFDRRTITDEFHRDIYDWVTKKDPWGREKKYVFCVGGPQFQPLDKDGKTVYVDNFIKNGAIPPSFIPPPLNTTCLAPGQSYPTIQQFQKGVKFAQAFYNNFGIIEWQLSGVSGQIFGEQANIFGPLINNNLPFAAGVKSWLSAEANIDELNSFKIYNEDAPEGQPVPKSRVKFENYNLRCYNCTPGDLVGLDLQSYPIVKSGLYGPPPEYKQFTWDVWSDKGAPDDWQEFGTGDYSTMSAWEYALRILATNNFGPQENVNGVGYTLTVPSTPNSADLGNIWDYHLLARQIYAMFQPDTGFPNDTMTNFRKNRPLRQINASSIENEAGVGGGLFTNAMYSLLTGDYDEGIPWCATTPAGYPNAGLDVCCPLDIPYKQGNGSACHDVTQTKRCALWGYPANGQICSSVPLPP